jgi:signal peptidase I
VVIVALALGLALAIQALLVKPYQIPTGSMEPTLDVGQRVLVNRALFHFRDPRVGDVIVFHPPAGADRGNECGDRQAGPDVSRKACDRPTPERSASNFIKRIVAGPGDRLRIKEGHPVVNGTAAEEDFVRPCKGLGACDLPEEVVVPPGHYFMMGDNRGASDDSRYWGPVPREWIIGQAFVTYWPPKRIGPL